VRATELHGLDVFPGVEILRQHVRELKAGENV
jgi:hypothetical protein